MKSHRAFALLALLVLVGSLLGLAPEQSQAYRPLRTAFFNVYPSAESSRLKILSSNSDHCGVCHFDFDGGGLKNPYGLAVEAAINSGLYSSDEEAIAAIENEDSDNDGFSNLIEITDTINFSNTPTFPGLTQSNLSSVSGVSVAEIEGHVTPSAPVGVGGGTVPGPANVLFQNSPNPFNPGTMIRYSVEREGRVAIRVYDVHGNLVRTLVNATRPAGLYELFWDGTGASGASVSSGVYFIRMEAEGYVASRKAIVLK